MQLVQDMTASLHSDDAEASKNSLKNVEAQLTHASEQAKQNITRMQADQLQWTQLQEKLTTTEQLVMSLNDSCQQLQQQSLDVTSIEYAREQLHSWQDFAHEKRQADALLTALRSQAAALEPIAAASCSLELKTRLNDLEEQLLCVNQTVDDEERNLEV